MQVRQPCSRPGAPETQVFAALISKLIDTYTVDPGHECIAGLRSVINAEWRVDELLLLPGRRGRVALFDVFYMSLFSNRKGMSNHPQYTFSVVHDSAVFPPKVTLSMLQNLTLRFCDGLGGVRTAEADLFWRALAALKKLRSFALLLNSDELDNAHGPKLLSSISVLTQIRWVFACPALLAADIVYSRGWGTPELGTVFHCSLHKKFVLPGNICKSRSGKLLMLSPI